jgi:type I restriction enzyme S subunit
LIFYVLNSPTGRQQLVFNSNTTTGLANLNGGILGDVCVAVAPAAEQPAIAAFLDRETGRLDQLVAKKRELIERLKEKRSALISRTVTRGLPRAAARAAGLPTNPPVKPSGIGWISEVPQHWETGNLRRFATMRTGHTPSRSEPRYWEDCTVPWFTLADVWQLRDDNRPAECWHS